MNISELQRKAWDTAEKKGFHIGRGGGRDDTLLRLCLVHTEVSEAAQIAKKHGTTSEHAKYSIAEELADTLIRIADLAECLGVDLEMAVLTKLKINESRPYLYGTPNEKGEKT